MLENQSLYFCRSDFLGDPCEGSFPKLDASSLFDYAIDPKSYKPTPQQVEATRKTLRYMMMINCWCKSNSDSYLMWETYTKTTESICIQTTLPRLSRCLDKQNEFSVLLANVKYLDYEKEKLPEGNILYPFVHKRQYFRDENEFRVIIWIPGDEWRYIDEAASPDDFPDGVSVHIEVDKLIESVYIHPAAPSWMKDTLEKLLKRYKLNCKIEKSAILEQPQF